jgi:hypothetical protein
MNIVSYTTKETGIKPHVCCCLFVKLFPRKAVLASHLPGLRGIGKAQEASNRPAGEKLPI